MSFVSNQYNRSADSAKCAWWHQCPEKLSIVVSNWYMQTRTQEHVTIMAGTAKITQDHDHSTSCYTFNGNTLHIKNLHILPLFRMFNSLALQPKVEVNV